MATEIYTYTAGLTEDTNPDLKADFGRTNDTSAAGNKKVALWRYGRGAKGADIASAATVNLDTATGDLVDVTGTTTVTAITLSEGRRQIVRFTGILTLTHGASLVLPTAANITTEAGDFALFVGYAAGVVRCAFYQRASGAALVGGGSTASTTEVLTGTDNAKSVTPDALAALWEQGSDIASAGIISVGEGGYFNVTGTTTITDIDFATDKAGRKVWLKFAGILTLTHHATTLILPTGANIVTAAGDIACFISEGADNVRCVSYTRASGAALAGGVAIGSTISGATEGSVLFAGASGALAQDNANLFWDDTNNRLGIGGAPSTQFQLTGTGDHKIFFSTGSAPETKFQGTNTSVFTRFVQESGGGFRLVTSHLSYINDSGFNALMIWDPAAAPATRFTMYAQNAATNPLNLQLAATPSANALNVTSSGGAVGDVASISASGAFGGVSGGPVKLSGTSRVATNVTNNTVTPANITGLSATVVAGRTYKGTIVLFYNQSVAADGFRFDLDGGTATATDLMLDGTIYDSTNVRYLGQATTLATDLTDTSTSGNARVVIEFTITVNTGGTIIPRFAMEAVSTGTGTTYRGSTMCLVDIG